MFPGSGSGAWEAALVNTLSPGDRVLMFDQGFFAAGWRDIAEGHGLSVDVIPNDWRRAADSGALAEKLDADADHQIAAVLLVHNEPTSGVTSDVGAIRAAMDAAAHPALVMVDAVSSRRSGQSTTGTTNGASTSRCRDRKRASCCPPG